MTDSLFAGDESLRVRGERTRLVLTLLFLPVSLGVVGFFFQNTITLHSLLLIVIGAMLFVALARGRFLGGGVRIGPGQFDHIDGIVKECAHVVGVAAPHVFLRDDPFVPVVSLGTGDPYALVFSSQYIELFTPGELRFLVGRELGHIAAGHAKLTSLLSANGRENAVVALAFGAWLRTIEYTADRMGLLCCGSLQTALGAIAASTFQGVGRKIDLHAFAEQRRELDAEPSLRMGEWLSSTPYATNRIARLAAFARDPLFLRWSERFAQRRAQAAPVELLAPDDPRRFAGPWRRAAAFVIDFIVVSALIPGVERQTPNPALNAELGRAHLSPGARHALEALASGGWGVSLTLQQGVVWAALAAYVVVLVAFAGQTLGMMICDLRVVGDQRERIGLRRALARYAFFALSLPIVLGFAALLRRVQPFEKWSRTRLINGNAIRP